MLEQLLSSSLMKDGNQDTREREEWRDLSSWLIPKIHLVQMQVCRKRSSVLPTNLSDTATTNQDGSSLKFITPIAIFRMQVAEGCEGSIFRTREIYGMEVNLPRSYSTTKQNPHICNQPLYGAIT